MCRCSSWGSDSGESRAILNVGETAIVAHEVMQPDRYLYLGIEGFSGDGHLVMPTIWASCGKIEYGANTCEDPSTDPELSVWNQLQTEMEQLKEYTLSQDQVDEVQACAQEAALAAQEAKQAADEVKQALSIGGSGLYYTPVVTQPTGDTLRFEFKPSVTGAPIPRPVIVELPVGEASDGNGDLSAVLMTAPDNNLIDDSALVTEFVDNTGAAVTGNYSNYIPVKAGHRYVTNAVPSRFDWFDKDKNHLKTEFRSPNPSILIPEQSGYLLVLLAADHSSSLVLKGTDIGAHRPAHRRLRSEYARDSWFGKRMLRVGDSITTDEDVYASDGYANMLGKSSHISHGVQVV